MFLPQQVINAKPIDWTGLPQRFMNPGELETLCALIASVTPKCVIEFGINTGRTAKALLREVPSIEKYVGVDVLPGYTTAMQVQHKEVPSIAGELVKGDKRVTLIVTPRGSHDLEPEQLPMCDAVFIDGDHSRSGVEKDTHLARSRLRRGGILVWHDYHNVMDKRGNPVVHVAQVLHEYQSAGCKIIHAAGTWLAFERP